MGQNHVSISTRRLICSPHADFFPPETSVRTDNKNNSHMQGILYMECRTSGRYFMSFEQKMLYKHASVSDIMLLRAFSCILYDIIYLLTATGLSPGGRSTVHIYTQTIHRTIQNKQYIEQHNNLEECGPCPFLASFTLAFALQLRKKHGKTSVRVAASKDNNTYT
jgi:hypothetical protein